MRMNECGNEHKFKENQKSAYAWKIRAHAQPMFDDDGRIDETQDVSEQTKEKHRWNDESFWAVE